MTVHPSGFQQITQSDFSQAYTTAHLVTILQSELAMLKAKVVAYYHEEIVLRGDKIMMREYCGHFGIAPANSDM